MIEIPMYTYILLVEITDLEKLSGERLVRAELYDVTEYPWLGKRDKPKRVWKKEYSTFLGAVNGATHWLKKLGWKIVSKRAFGQYVRCVIFDCSH